MQLRQKFQYWPFHVVWVKLQCDIIEVFLVTRNNTALCTANTLYMLGIKKKFLFGIKNIGIKTPQAFNDNKILARKCSPILRAHS